MVTPHTYRSATRSGRKLAHRGRVAVTVLAGLWLTSQAALTCVLESTGPWLRDPFYADKEQKLRVRITAKSATGPPHVVVMFGSSRTSNGLKGMDADAVLEASLGRPAVVFNFGIPAAGPITHTINLRRLLDRGVRPDVVLLEILPSQLAAGIVPPVESNFLRPERFLASELDVACSYGFHRQDTQTRWTLCEAFPIYGLRLPMLGRWMPNWIPWNQRADASRNTDVGGWQRPICESVTPKQREEGVARARREYYALLQLLHFDGPASQALMDSIAVCQRERIPVALVLMPEGREFRSWYPQAVQERLQSFIRGLNAPLIDARSWLPDDAFSDSHHQLSIGASAFTRRLAETVLDLKLHASY